MFRRLRRYPAEAGSSVEINRQQRAWTWTVVVAAESNSLADLEEAKRKARQIDEQLESEIGPNKARPTGAKQGSIEDQPDPESSA